MQRSYLFFVYLLASIIKFTEVESRKPLITWQLGDPPVDIITWMCVKRLKARRSWGRIASDGYPRKVATKNTRCSWKILAPAKKRVRISFKAMFLRSHDTDNCPDNYVLVIDENIGRFQQRLCGKSVPDDIVSSKSSIRIDFQIDVQSIADSKGFMLNYKYTNEKPGFYDKNGPATTTLRPTMTIPSKNLGRYRSRKNEDGSAVSTITILIVVAIIVVVVLLIGFIYKKKLNRDRKREEKINEEEKQENQDSDLPSNPIDPFERIDAACQLPPHYHPTEEVEKRLPPRYDPLPPPPPHSPPLPTPHEEPVYENLAGPPPPRQHLPPAAADAEPNPFSHPDRSSFSDDRSRFVADPSTRSRTNPRIRIPDSQYQRGRARGRRVSRRGDRHRHTMVHDDVGRRSHEFHHRPYRRRASTLGRRGGGGASRISWNV